MGEHDTKLIGHGNKLGEHGNKLGEHDNKLADQLAKINANKNELQNNLKLHSDNKINPHSVTAKQVGALPITGGTITGNIRATQTVSGNKGIFTSLKTNGLMDGSIDWGNGARIGLVTNVGDDKRLWLHIGGYEQKKAEGRFLALYANIYISGNLHVESRIFSSYDPTKTMINDVYLSSNNDSKIGKGKSVSIDDHRHGSVNSSRDIKKNISPITIEYATREIIEKLKAVKFVFKDDPKEEEHLGFIAEDVPDIISDKDHKTVKVMDIVASLVKVVQEQQNEIEKLKRIKYNSKNIYHKK